MRLPWMLWCLLWASVCRGLPQNGRVQQQQQNQAQECELYDPTSHTAPPVMQFQRRISVGLLPQKISSSKLVLQSTTTKKTCWLFVMPGSITPYCGQGVVSPEKLLEGYATELWIEVAPRSGDVSHAVWDLKVVGRQEKQRVHMLIPDTGLQPPVNLWMNSSDSMQYYFNCVTGCLLEKYLALPPGDHTFFLRHDEGFVQMTLDCGFVNYPTGNFSIIESGAELGPPGILKDVNYSMKKLSINVTAAELGPPGGMKKVTVVWSTQLGDIGLLVDGVPVGGLTEYEPLKKEREVKVQVAEGGSGLVAPCDSHFQMVACGDDEDVTAATTEPSTSSSSTYDPSTDNPSPQPILQPSSGWLLAVFTFVVLNFIVVVAAVSLAVLLYYRSSSETCHIEKGNSDAPAIFSRRSSVRSSTRSGHRGSQRRKNQNDAAQERTPESPSGGTRANSETVTTPLTTPDSLAHPRTQRQLSTDEFVDLNLI